MQSKFYTVSYFTTFGMRMYLSTVGYNLPGSKGFVFEPGFSNARKFDTQAEAKNTAQAIGSVPYEQIIISKHEISNTGVVKITVTKGAV